MIDKSGRKGDNKSLLLFKLLFIYPMLVEEYYIRSPIQHDINIYWYLEVLGNKMLRLKTWVSINVSQEMFSVLMFQQKNWDQKVFLSYFWIIVFPTTKLTFQKRLALKDLDCFVEIQVLLFLFIPSANIYFAELLFASPVIAQWQKRTYFFWWRWGEQFHYTAINEIILMDM